MNLHPFLRRFIKGIFRRKVFTNKILAIVVDLRIKLLYSLNSWYYGLFEVYLYSSLDSMDKPLEGSSFEYYY